MPKKGQKFDRQTQTYVMAGAEDLAARDARDDEDMIDADHAKTAFQREEKERARKWQEELQQRYHKGKQPPLSEVRELGDSEVVYMSCDDEMCYTLPNSATNFISTDSYEEMYGAEPQDHFHAYDAKIRAAAGGLKRKRAKHMSDFLLHNDATDALVAAELKLLRAQIRSEVLEEVGKGLIKLGQEMQTGARPLPLAFSGDSEACRGNFITHKVRSSKMSEGGGSGVGQALGGKAERLEGAGGGVGQAMGGEAERLDGAGGGQGQPQGGVSLLVRIAQGGSAEDPILAE
jgi:hypothetical protein